MSTHHDNIVFETRGDCDMIDITHAVEDTVNKSRLKTGICTVFCTGSTGSITTIEYEEGLLEDFPVAMERLAPTDAVYVHHLRWRDGNGHSHVRASILGPGLTVPFVNGKLTLGTWQQITFIDFDNKPRSRKLEIVLIGE
ncbi:MAG: secondary thiamine-phosphate synthase enzyme YjbQ [Candidatus Thorarchaeota archaeon]